MARMTYKEAKERIIWPYGAQTLLEANETFGSYGTIDERTRARAKAYLLAKRVLEEAERKGAPGDAIVAADIQTAIDGFLQSMEDEDRAQTTKRRGIDELF